jgi:hypothetical protein
MSGIGGVQGDMQAQLQTAQTTLANAQTQAASGLNDINNNWVPKPNPAFKTMEEAQRAIGAGTISPGANATWTKDAVLKGLTALFNAQSAVDALGEAISSLQGLKKLLDSGDIEGAVMLLQTTRAKLMDAQLGTQIKAMQERNAQITSLNNQLTAAQQTLAGYSGTDTSDDKKKATKLVGDLKTAIDSLNSDSQIDMIRTQSLVNKRNEAFDTLTNLLGKFQKTIDGIVGNYR